MKTTIDDLGKKYLAMLKNSPKKETVNTIVQEINNLTYVDTGDYISINEKIRIANKIKEKYYNGMLLEHSDNSALLSLIDMIAIALEVNK